MSLRYRREEEPGNPHDQHQSAGFPTHDGSYRVPTELLTSYTVPITYEEIRTELELIRLVTVKSLREWKREVSLYEQSIPKRSRAARALVRTKRDVPRRNYLNEDGLVMDPELFPYHTACYPLLDAYDHLHVRYRPDVAVIRATDEQTLQNPHPREAPVPGHLPCSDAAIAIATGVSNTMDKRLVDDEWENGLKNRLFSHAVPDFYARWVEEEEEEDTAVGTGFGIAAFPEDTDARADLLFKLLMHACSELQKDYWLAIAILLRMSAWKLLQNEWHLRKVLSIITSQQPSCDGYCFERFWAADDEEEEEIPDHSCHAWKLFETTVSLMLTTGIEYFTYKHAEVVSGAVHFSFNLMNPAAAKLDESLVEEALDPDCKPSVEEKQRELLKRNLYLSRNAEYEYESDDSEEDDDDDSEADVEEIEVAEETVTVWLDQLVIGVGAHGTFCRKRILQIRERLLRTTDDDSEALIVVLRKSIDSFHHCVRCLVNIGEAALRRLPMNRRTAGFCSRLVLCLTQLFVEPNRDFMKHDRTYLHGGSSIIDPNRYSDSILSATKNYRQRHFPEKSTLEVGNEVVRQAIDDIDAFLRAPPHSDVQDLVRCLFAKDLVETSISRCGYGDFQVWCGLPVSPLDPFIFFYECNSPQDETSDTAWVTDEDGNELWDNRLNARNDFALVLLLRAWHAPWAIASHHSFQKPFREAVTTLLLCANRLGMAFDIATHVSSFLPRDWWPDERTSCWCEECQEKEATKLLDQKLLERVQQAPTGQRSIARSRKEFQYCRGCRVASYCSDAHRQTDYRGGHKSLCSKPPYRITGKEEDELFRDVLAWMDRTSNAQFLNESTRLFLASQVSYEVNDVDDDDSGSWESIDSSDEADDEEAVQGGSITEIIHRFFEKTSYRRRRDA